MNLRYTRTVAHQQRTFLGAERDQHPLQGRRLLFVFGSYVGKRPLYAHVQALGAHLVVIDGPGHWVHTTADLFEQTIEVDLYPDGALIDRVLAAVQSTGLTFDAVATLEEQATPLTAFLAKALGLPGHSPAAVCAARNKLFTRQRCVSAGLPSPRFAAIHSIDDLPTAAAVVGFPAVLKPIAGFSSLFTFRVESLADLRQRYTQIEQTLAGQLKSNGVHSDDEHEMIWLASRAMILEEYLAGEEYDVDCLLRNGELVYAAIVRDLPEPFMKEGGSQMPTPLPPAQEEALIQFAHTTLCALGFDMGVFHVEVKATPNGPRLLEVNARIGGGPIWFFHKTVWGVDLLENYLLLLLGQPITPVKAPAPLAYLITSDLPAPRTGIVAHDRFLEPLRNHPHVIGLQTKVKPGQPVIGPDTGVPEWLGEIMVCGESVKQAAAILNDLLTRIELPICADLPIKA